MEAAITIGDQGPAVRAAQLVLVSLGMLDSGHEHGTWDVASQAAAQRWAAGVGVALRHADGLTFDEAMVLAGSATSRAASSP